MDRLDPAPAAALLLAWFAANQRTLPWRQDPSPYHVLLSELMLQQTRVQTVLPYFARFVERWPTLDALAAATEEEVLQEWSGLGYYSRARNLLRCAQAAVEAGGLPDSVSGLRELPGIGPYTAGAVASIAFRVRTALVDGNVERVISRLDARPEDPKRAGKKAMWARVTELHDAAPSDSHPGDLNQALMELGATVCTPRSPRCGGCPLQAGCLAEATGDPESFPVLPARKKPTPVRGVAGLAWIDGHLVMGRRPPGLLGGLWEPIGAEIDPTADPALELRTAFFDRAGLQVEVLGLRGEVTHTFTHRKLTCSVFDVRASRTAGETGVPHPADYYTDVRLVDDPESVPLSALARRILALGPQLGLPLAADRSL